MYGITLYQRHFNSNIMRNDAYSLRSVIHEQVLYTSKNVLQTAKFSPSLSFTSCRHDNDKLVAIGFTIWLS